MKKKRRIWLIILLVVLVIIVLVSVFSGRRELTEVSLAEAARRTIVETVSASGKIQPETEIKVQSEVSGQIIELPVKEGQLVERGQLLVRINPDIYVAALNRADAALNGARSNLASSRARVAQAEAQLTVQELNHKRISRLFADQAVSAAEMENAQSAWETARAEVTAAKESIRAAEFSIESAQASRNEAADNLRRTTIVAPMSGTITALNKEVGENVLGNNMMSGEVIMKISALEAMEVNVEVNESDIVRIAIGDTAEVEVDAYGEETFLGVVSEIGNTALNAAGGAMTMDQVTNFSVRVRILRESYAHLCEEKPASYSPFRPGMSATVDIRTARAEDVLTVPIKSVTSREDTSSVSLAEHYREKKNKGEGEEDAAYREPFTVVFVFRPEDQTARIRVVRTGIQDDRYIAILEGVEDGERVITGPYDQVSRILRPGTKVMEKETEEEEEE